MASLNRTSEFFRICELTPPSSSHHVGSSTSKSYGDTIAGKSSGRYGNTTVEDPNDELRTFHKTASMISKEIYSTSALLQELTTAIHSRTGSLFVGNDETSNVNDLVLRIKSNVETLNVKLDDANDMIQRSKRRLGRNSQAGMEAGNLVKQLQEEFVNTTKDFKDVLQVRSERIKERSARENTLLGDSEDGDIERISLLGNKPRIYAEGPWSGKKEQTSDKAVVPSFGQSTSADGGGLRKFGSIDGPRLDLTSAIMTQSHTSAQTPGGESTTQLPRPYGIKEDGNSGIRLRHLSNSNRTNSDAQSSFPVYTPLDMQRMEEQMGQTQQMQLIPDQSYLRERADAMSAVETNIVELGTIFNKLAVMVNEHSEMVQRVEDNVADASDNLTLSLDTLTDTLHNLRSNKQLFFRLMTVLVVFCIVFITCFA